jgi:hypothetical protein
MIYLYNIYDVHWNLVDIWYRGFISPLTPNEGDYVFKKGQYIKFMGEYKAPLKKELS